MEWWRFLVLGALVGMYLHDRRRFKRDAAALTIDRDQWKAAAMGWEKNYRQCEKTRAQALTLAGELGADFGEKPPKYGNN